MRFKTSVKKLAIIGSSAMVLGVLLFAGSVLATHSWGGYHWAHTMTPFTLRLGDNVSSAWDAYLATASADWSADPAVLYATTAVAKVLNTTIVSGTSNPKNCKAVAGTVQVCNSKYGNNGWLGIAQISIMGGTHITQGAVKLNDTYFNTTAYNTPAWRQMVVCQEIGHTFGLDHQDENFSNANLGTCMDYANDPSTNQHPNFHDYEELALIYGHLDSFNSFSATSASTRGASADARGGSFENAAEWGKALSQDSRGRNNKFERDLGNGEKLFTFVTWAE